MKIINSAILELALEFAACEAYQCEVIDTEMEDSLIGCNAEYKSAEEWIRDKVKWWIDSVSEKFKTFHQSKTIEYNEPTVKAAYIFYKLKLGETININDKTMITRVPGGWMWVSVSHPRNGTFIPYNNEFMSIIEGEGD